MLESVPFKPLFFTDFFLMLKYIVIRKVVF